MIKFKIILSLSIYFFLFSNICKGHNHWWWMPEYNDLVQFVKSSSGLSTTFSTSQGDDKTKIFLSVEKNSFILKMDMPNKAIYSIDKNGNKIYSKKRHVIYFMDSNLDGKLDYYKPSNSSYINFNNTENEAGILLYWIMMMGFSVNNFIYGIPSPYQQ